MKLSHRVVMMLIISVVLLLARTGFAQINSQVATTSVIRSRVYPSASTVEVRRLHRTIVFIGCRFDKLVTVTANTVSNAMRATIVFEDCNFIGGVSIDLLSLSGAMSGVFLIQSNVTGTGMSLSSVRLTSGAQLLVRGCVIATTSSLARDVVGLGNVVVTNASIVIDGSTLRSASSEDNFDIINALACSCTSGVVAVLNTELRDVTGANEVESAIDLQGCTFTGCTLAVIGNTVAIRNNRLNVFEFDSTFRGSTITVTNNSLSSTSDYFGINTCPQSPCIAGTNWSVGEFWFVQRFGGGAQGRLIQFSSPNMLTMGFPQAVRLRSNYNFVTREAFTAQDVSAPQLNSNEKLVIPPQQCALNLDCNYRDTSAVSGVAPAACVCSCRSTVPFPDTRCFSVPPPRFWSSMTVTPSASITVPYEGLIENRRSVYIPVAHANITHAVAAGACRAIGGWLATFSSASDLARMHVALSLKQPNASSLYIIGGNSLLDATVGGVNPLNPHVATWLWRDGPYAARNRGEGTMFFEKLRVGGRCLIAGLSNCAWAPGQPANFTSRAQILVVTWAGAGVQLSTRVVDNNTLAAGCLCEAPFNSSSTTATITPMNTSTQTQSQSIAKSSTFSPTTSVTAPRSPTCSATHRTPSLSLQSSSSKTSSVSLSPRTITQRTTTETHSLSLTRSRPISRSATLGNSLSTSDSVTITASPPTSTVTSSDTESPTASLSVDATHTATPLVDVVVTPSLTPPRSCFGLDLLELVGRGPLRGSLAPQAATTQFVKASDVVFGVSVVSSVAGSSSGGGGDDAALRLLAAHVPSSHAQRWSMSCPCRAVLNHDSRTSVRPNAQGFASSAARSTSCEAVIAHDRATNAFTINVTVGAVREYSLVTSETANVTLSVARIAPCVLLGADATERFEVTLLTLRVEAPTIALVEDTRKAAQAVGLVTAASGLAIAPGGAVVDQQGSAVVGLLACADPYERKMLGNYRLLAPTALSESFMGVVLGNIALLSAVTMAHFLIVICFWKLRGVERFSGACASLRFPSLPFRVLIMLFQGTAFASVQLASRQYDDDGAVVPLPQRIFGGAMAFVTIVVVPAAIVTFVHCTITCEFGLYHYAKVERLRRFPLALVQFALPSGRWWQPAHMRKLFGALFSAYQRREKLWVTSVLWSAIILAVGSAFRPSSTWLCEVQMYALAACQVLFATITAVLRPHRSAAANMLSVISTMTLATILAGSAAGVANPRNEIAKSCIAGAAQVQMIVSVVRVLHAALVWAVERTILRGAVLDTVFSWTPPEAKDMSTASTSRNVDEDNAGAGRAAAMFFVHDAARLLDDPLLFDETAGPDVFDSSQDDADDLLTRHHKASTMALDLSLSDLLDADDGNRSVELMDTATQSRRMSRGATFAKTGVQLDLHEQIRVGLTTVVNDEPHATPDVSIL